ncbi:unnamed protein product [Leuciscus chuanchicus]
MTSTFSHAINRPGANVRKGSDEGPAVKTLEMEASHRKNWDPGSETSPLLEENTSLSGLAGKSGRGAQPGLRGRNQQTFPGGLVVRIRRSHRRGPGSIPGQGMSFCPPAAVVIAKCPLQTQALTASSRSTAKEKRPPSSRSRTSDLRIANLPPTVLRSTS